jgi:hypothetical protein
MAQETVVSKTLTIELDTGQTKIVVTRGQGNRETSRRTEPVTVRVPKLSTVTTYNRDDQGVITNAATVVRQEISADDYAKLDDNDRSTGVKGAGRGERTVYYAILARKAGDSNEYKTTDAVGEVLDKETATLFEKAAADHSNERQGSTFSNFDKATNDVIKKTEGLQDADARNQTDLSGAIPGPTTTEEEPSADIPNLNSLIKKTNLDYGKDMRYPEDMNDYQDCIQFSAIEYGPLRKTEKDKKSVFSLGTRQFGGTISATVTLPIQNRIADSNLVDWGEGRLNPLQSLAFGVVTADKGVMDQAKKIVSQFQNNTNNITTDTLEAGKTLAFQEALQTQGLLSRATGLIVNPNVELLFKAPLLRQFGFSFFLAARSDTETTMVKRIIRFFKENMAVKNSTSDIFLKAPNVFDIKYLHASEDHSGIGKIKRCALRSFNVEYNPDGTYMTFEDGTMTAYRITMQFQELLPITSDDYDEQTRQTDIGY